MDELANQPEQSDPHRDGAEDDGLRADDAANVGVTAYIARVSAWWLHVTGREGHEPMSYYDQ
jgi:hypothetical protein